MKILKAYKFRLKTNAAIENQLSQFAGCCRKIWNMVLAASLRRLSYKQPIMWYHEADFWSKLWKQSEEYGYLKDCPAQVIQQKLKDLDKAFRDAFDKNQPLKRLPNWREKGKDDSFRYPQHFKIENKRIFLPKIGWVPFFKSKAIQGIPKNVTISRRGCHWYMSVQVECEQSLAIHTSQTAIGIDLGISRFAALSDGTSISAISSYRKYESKVTKLQKSTRKKKKFSNNWKKVTTKLNQLHQKIANVRNDFLHKCSTLLSKNHAMIVVEDLKITNMSRSAKGTLENPGHNVRAKSGLNKSILDQGWGEFRRQLKYKLEWLGGIFIKVNPQYSSQKCNPCGYTSKENRKSQSHFQCIRCHHIDNADTNAAKNVLAAGHAVLACGEAAIATSMKQEPLGIGDLVPV